MSFAEKFTNLMARPGQEGEPKDDAPWYLKYGARVLGIIAAFFAIIFGFTNVLGIITINISCVLSGMLQILLGVLVMVLEAPCCCLFLDHVQNLADKADKRPHWNRAALYCGASIIPVILCVGLGSIFACGLVFGTGVLYGMMSLGKKATSEQMRNAALSADIKNATNSSQTTTTSSTTRSNLVNNAQPTSITIPPAFDSNV